MCVSFGPVLNRSLAEEPSSSLSSSSSRAAGFREDSSLYGFSVVIDTVDGKKTAVIVPNGRAAEVNGHHSLTNGIQAT